MPADQTAERGPSPSARDGKVFLTPAQLAMLLEGIDWRQPKRLLTSLTML
ncbi:transposase (plasmid) [Klebsiella pneumoniae]|nr:transposase [Klebsiella pneumoniae]